LRAVILVGGYGTRLRPLTCHRPKQLLPLANSTLIEFMISQLKMNGIKEIVLAAGFGIKKIQEALGDGRDVGVNLHYSIEDKPLGTAGPIKLAESYLRGNGFFFVLNGDIVADIDYSLLLKYHRDHNASATIALHRVNDTSRFGVVDLRADGCIQAFVEKPKLGTAPSNLINAGCYILDESVLDLIPSGKKLSIEREIFPQLCKEGGVYGYEHKGLWIDTGTPASYLEANRVILKTITGKSEVIASTSLMKKGAKITNPVLIGESISIGKSCSIGPNVNFGRNVTLGDNVQIRNAIVFDDVTIKDNVDIDHAVVGKGAIIGRGIHLSKFVLVGDAVTIDEGVVVPPGARICPNRRVRPGATPYTVFC
jgi:mannose-1-phosphate guanylyltransferase